MCGRTFAGVTNRIIPEPFHAQPNPAELTMPDADYNVAPTTHQLILRQSRETRPAGADSGSLGFGPVLHERPERHQGALDHQRPLGDDHQGSDMA